MNDADLLIICLILATVVISILVAWAAEQRGRSAAAWFFISMLISPILAVLVLLAVPVGPRASGRLDSRGEPSKLTDADFEIIRRHKAEQRAADLARRMPSHPNQ